MKFVFYFLIILSMTGCGQKMVTLNLNVAMPKVSSDAKSIIHPTGPPVGFCKQDSLLAGVILNPRTPESQVISLTKIPLETNFPDWNGTAPADLNEILSFLAPPLVRYNGNVQVQVPANTPVEVGIVGKLMLGVSAGAEVCAEGYASSDWLYSGVTGSLFMTPTSSMSLSVPAIVSRKVINTTCTSATECYSLNLATAQARNGYVALFITLPSSGLLLTYTKAYAVISPENSTDPSIKITYSLKSSMSAMTNTGSILSGPPTPATFATLAFALPRVLPIELRVEGFDSGSSPIACKVVLSNGNVIQKLWTTADHSLAPDFNAIVITAGDWICG